MSHEKNGNLTQIAVRVGPEILQRLDLLAARTGRTRTYYLREALIAHIATLEAIYLGEQELIDKGRDSLVTPAAHVIDGAHAKSHGKRAERREAIK